MENKQAIKDKTGDDRRPFMIITDQNNFVEGSILESFATKATPGESQQLRNDPFQDKYENKGLIAPLYNPSYLMGLSELNTYHDICCDVKSVDVAGLGWKLIPIGDNPSMAEEKVLQEFFKRVFQDNPFTKAQRDKEELGYCSIEMVREANNPEGLPYNLFHVPAHTIRIHKDFDKYCQERGGEYRWFKRIGAPGVISPLDGNTITPESLYNGVAASEIIWNTNYTSKSSYYGRPKIIPALRALLGQLSAMDFNIAFFQNYGVPAYAVFVSGNYDDRPVDPNNPEGETYLQSKIREKFQTLQSNPHSTMIFSIPSMDEEGKIDIQFEKLSVETKEGSFRLYRSDNRDEIIAAHRVDPHRIGININGPLGGDTAITARRNYKASVQAPEQEIWNNLINSYIIQSEDGFGFHTWKFEFVSFELEDETIELDLIKRIFPMGGITPNQIIRKYKERFGLEEVDHPAMDCHYINGQPIEYQLIGDEGSADPAAVVAKVLDKVETQLLEVHEHERSVKDGPDRRGVFGLFKNILPGKKPKSPGDAPRVD